MLRQACLQRRDAVPPTLTELAVVPGIPEARYRLDREIAPLIRDVHQANHREAQALARAGEPNDMLPLANMLAVSGGSDAGTFAAGIIAGWLMDAATFKVVTGISWGPGRPVLPGASMTTSFCASAAPSAPKTFSVAQCADPTPATVCGRQATVAARCAIRHADILAAIAAQYANGRLLMIGTTDLDAGRP
jgi:hypothetical protein